MVLNAIAAIVPIVTPTKPKFHTKIIDKTTFIITSIIALSCVSLKWPAAKTNWLYGNRMQ